MNFHQTSQYLSKPRFDRYLTATNNDFDRAVVLYKAGLKIAAAFHPLLGLLEVTLRNQLNQILTNFFKDPDWIINQKSGFMSDLSLTYRDRRTGQLKINDFLKKSVETAEAHFKRKGTSTTAGKIIAEQNFSFWTDLFEVHHYRLLQGRPIQIFQQLPTGKGRLAVWDALTNIRIFRNRINHNEPICFNGAAIDFSKTENIYKAITDIFAWIDTNLISWTTDIDHVTQTISAAKAI